MKEKEIIKGTLITSKKFKIFFGIVCLIILFVIFDSTYQSANISQDEMAYLCFKHKYTWACEVGEITTFEHWFNLLYGPILTLIPIGIYILILLFMKFDWDAIELTVTNKRVYGKTVFGKRVDLPLDSISSIGKIKLFKGVSIATSSGKISFCFIKNNDDVYNAISELLVDRQDKKENKSVAENNDYIEELKKLKELMDDGVITKEEFEKKKKELLN